MPTYAYRCQACDHRFDAFQKFSEDPLTACPECSVGTVSRVVQPVGIVFKGSGWYINDSRPKAADTEAKPSAEKKPNSSDKQADSSDKKADTPATNGTNEKQAAKEKTPAAATAAPAAAD